MKVDILTLFPSMFKGPFSESIIKRAQEKELVAIKIHNLRDWAVDKHGTVDDRPYGGGPGMVLMCQPIFDAVEEIKSQSSIILLTPQGKLFNQKIARRLAKINHLILICGHYEGVDERVRKRLVDEEISIGDYVLTGGELPAMVLVDTIVRLLPGALKKEEAIKEESFAKGLLEYPQYTRPANFRGWKVPAVLLSGDHREIAEWRKKKSLERTKKRRPELLKL